MYSARNYSNNKKYKEYPGLVIQLNNDLACINYFSEDENEINWTSVGNYNKETLFLAGGEEWLAPKNTITTVTQAIKCIKEFSKNEKKPECIEWQKLI